VTDYLKNGENVLLLHHADFKGLTLGGRTSLCRKVDPQSVRARKSGDTSLTVTCGDEKWQLVLDNPPAALAKLGDLETDARYAAITPEGRLAAVDVTTIAGSDDIALHSLYPMSLAVDGDTIDLGDLPADNEFFLQTPAGTLACDELGSLAFHAVGAHELTLRYRAPWDRPVVVNGRRTEAMHDPLTDTYTIEVRPEREDVAAAAGHFIPRMSRAYKLLYLPGKENDKALVGLLGDEVWQVQCAAAEALGLRRSTAAVEPLVDLLRKEQEETVYPDLLGRGDVLRQIREGTTDYLGGQSPDEVAKRFRLKVFICRALGRIGDEGAVPALHEALENRGDFYPVHVAALKALMQLQDTSAIELVRSWTDHMESNTRNQAVETLKCLETVAEGGE
jgi:hypothetical protein